MSIKVKFNDPDAVLDRLGLKPGGDAHKYFMTRAAAYMRPYLPYRANGSVVDALLQGMDYRGARFVLKGPHQAYLYYGKVMAGKPKKATDKDLKYTKNPHALAGPFYDKRMMQDKGQQLAQEITDYMRKK